jgi:hypothetical protein
MKPELAMEVEMLNYVFGKMPQLGKLVVTVLIMFASSL